MEFLEQRLIKKFFLFHLLIQGAVPPAKWRKRGPIRLSESKMTSLFPNVGEWDELNLPEHLTYAYLQSDCG